MPFVLFVSVSRSLRMATEQPKPATEDAKIDLFEDDDEFEEFEIDQGLCGFLLTLILGLVLGLIALVNNLCRAHLYSFFFVIFFLTRVYFWINLVNRSPVVVIEIGFQNIYVNSRRRFCVILFALISLLCIFLSNIQSFSGEHVNNSKF